MNEVFLESLRIFEGIPSSKIQSVAKCLRIQTYYRNKDTSLLPQSGLVENKAVDNLPADVCYLAAGFARIILRDSSGSRTILETISEDTVVYDDLSLNVFTDNDLDIIATESCTLLKLSFTGQINSCSCCIKYANAIRSNLLASMAEKNMRLMKKLCMISNRSIHEKNTGIPSRRGTKIPIANVFCSA